MVEVITGSTRTIEANRKILKAWRAYYNEHNLLHKAQWSRFDEEMWYQARRAYKFLLLHDSSFMPYKPISPKRERFKVDKNGKIQFYENGQENYRIGSNVS